MAEPITILPDEWRGRHMRVPIDQITVKEGRAREPDLSAESIAKLAESIRRQGLQQPIGVRADGEDVLRWSLLWGRRRLEAYLAHADLGGRARQIDVMAYPRGMPNVWAEILELDENFQRET